MDIKTSKQAARDFVNEHLVKGEDKQYTLSHEGFKAIFNELAEGYQAKFLAKDAVETPRGKKLLCFDNPHRVSELRKRPELEGWDIKSFQDAMSGQGYDFICVVEPAGKHWRDQEKAQEFIKQIHTRLYPGGFFMVI